MAEQILLYPFRNRIKRGISQSELMQWLEFLSPDILKFEEDFVGKVDVTYKFGTRVIGTGSAAVTGTVASTVNGICRLTTGTTNNGYAGIFPNTDATLEGAAFLGNNSAVMWARVCLSAITNAKMEVGFTDADDDNGAVSTLATPTCTADDCAVWCFDTSDTGNPQWQGVYRRAAGTAVAIEPDLVDIVAATYEWLGVALLGDKVKFMHADQYGNPDYESAWYATAITATDALVPWIFAQTRSTTSKSGDVDYMIAYQRRTATND